MKSIKMNPPRVVEIQQLVKLQFKGLCINCENRHNCTFPRPKNGVLFCDEYE